MSVIEGHPHPQPNVRITRSTHVRNYGYAVRALGGRTTDRARALSLVKHESASYHRAGNIPTAEGTCTMSAKIRLNAAMGTPILEFLSQYQRLPQQGLVAGQAVASAIDALFGRHAPVVNDIDVFRKVRPDGKVGANLLNRTAKRHTIAVTRFDDPGFSDPYSGMAEALRLVDTYAIQSVSRDQLLNYVNCTTTHGDVPLTAARVLAGFDLNCVRVGVDLSSRRLVWDRHFERFLATRQIEIAMLHTPYHTLIRFLRKLNQLPGVYGNVGVAAEICAGISKSRHLGKLVKEGHVSALFGKKMREQGEGVASALSPFFVLETHDFSKQVSGSAVTWQKLPARSDAGADLQLWSLCARGDLDYELQRRLDRLGPAVLTHGAKLIYDAKRSKSKAVAVRFEEMRSAFAERSLPSAVAWNLKLFGDAYVEGHALEDIGHKVEGFLRQHRGFAGPLMGLTLGAQYEAIKGIKDVAREFQGQASLGVLESLAAPSELLVPDAMREILKREAAESTSLFDVRPMRLAALPAVFAHYEVKELLTKAHLQREGSEMSHCVGGYGRLVQTNQARVLSIRPKEGQERRRWSTVEVRDIGTRDRKNAFGPSAQLCVVQHMSVRNSVPDPTNEAILRYLVAVHGKDPVTALALRVLYGTKLQQVCLSTMAWMRPRLQRLYKPAQAALAWACSATRCILPGPRLTIRKRRG